MTCLSAAVITTLVYVSYRRADAIRTQHLAPVSSILYAWLSTWPTDHAGALEQRPAAWPGCPSPTTQHIIILCCWPWSTGNRGNGGNGGMGEWRMEKNYHLWIIDNRTTPSHHQPPTGRADGILHCRIPIRRAMSDCSILFPRVQTPHGNIDVLASYLCSIGWF